MPDATIYSSQRRKQWAQVRGFIREIVLRLLVQLIADHFGF